MPLVKVSHVLQTPHGPVIAGELVVGEYLAPGELRDSISGEELPTNALVLGDIGAIDEIGHEVGFGFLKKIGRGLKKVGKVAVKLHTAPLKFAGKVTKGVVKAHVNVLKRTGKIVAKGTVAAVKYAKKNPVKALALAAIPGALGVYATYKAAKFVGKKVAQKLGGGGGAQEELPPSEEQQALPPMEPESSPGEQEPTTEPPEETAPPDVLEAPEAEAPPEDEGGGEAEESEEAGESENSVEGERQMPYEEQWVGLDEIAGEEIAGDDDYVGAAPKRRAAPGPNAAKVKSTGYTKYRRQYLPIASSSIAAGASATITVAPQTLFRGRRLSVPAAIAPSFLIDDLKVGNVSQGAAAGSVPAESFVANATGEDNIQMDTASPGKTISINVTNTSGGALTFRATLFGDSVQ